MATKYFSFTHTLSTEEIVRFGIGDYVSSCYPAVVKANATDVRITPYTCAEMLAYVSTKRLPEPIEEWEAKYVEKLGPQGGPMDHKKVRQGLMNYYTPEIVPDLNFAYQCGQRLKMWFLHHGISKPVSLGDLRTPRNTAGGLPHRGRRRDLENMQMFLEADSLPSGPLYALLASFRYQLLKWRVVFGDSTWNYGMVSRTIDTLTALLSTLPEYDCWLNPRASLRPAITTALRQQAWFISGDVSRMDQNLRLEVVKLVCFPTFEVALCRADYEKFVTAVEQSYYLPIVLGREVFHGLHTTPSGMPFVPIVETMVTHAIQLAAATRVPSSPLFLKQKGDDAIAAYLLADHARRFQLAYVDCARGLGLPCNEWKVGLSNFFAEYCKCSYWEGAPRDVDGNVAGSYTTPLLVNGLVHPETAYPIMPQALGACLARLANYEGNPRWEDAMVYFLHALPRQSLVIPEFTSLTRIARDGQDLTGGNTKTLAAYSRYMRAEGK